MLSSITKLQGFFPRDHKQRGKEKAPQPQLESAVCTEKNTKVGS